MFNQDPNEDKKVNEYELDVGSIIDNSDCVAEIKKTFATEAEAQDEACLLISKAEAASSEPLKIKQEIQQTEQGFELALSIEFTYQAEMMIFQFAIR